MKNYYQKTHGKSNSCYMLSFKTFLKSGVSQAGGKKELFEDQNSVALIPELGSKRAGGIGAISSSDLSKHGIRRPMVFSDVEISS